MGSKVQRKEILDKLLRKYKAQPVGSGYIDIIVMRDKYKCLAEELFRNGFIVRAISWWEYIDDVNIPNSYGMGGPVCRFYDGKFAETCSDIDELPKGMFTDKSIGDLVNHVETKILGEYEGKVVSYKATPSLTPAFWLDMDNDWKNIQ
ncbi:hypothetical protein [Candidatus Reidiella endopervernicosa]|uniref:Uncharacterized protein n=1 Tax=Candidatus Reidiella endopervernicosa TaxID=2738883 RepID=A0A6N0HWD4_9GAMM|nr:hypothetical protein [Candidatus Reidiella endopervernicosa]QKQ26679.1 hypothetical protein HUE57_10605 [Candidatus Reidiella endopervernicosa]